jgi:AraC-like DNA-binding protein
MDVVQDRQGRYFVGTESGGVNMIAGNDPLASPLAFRHIREHFHVQPNDIVQSLTVKDDGGLIAVGSHLITLMDSTQHGRVMDASEFQEKYRFSEAHPLSLGNGRWLFGLLDGAIIMSESQMQRQIYKPRLVLTNLEVRGERSEVRDWWGIENMDTLTLQPHERNATIHFAAIDYQSAERINYAFRLSVPGSDTTAWNYIGRNRSATLLDLKPGEYLLQIRCTNADGEWLDQMRQLTIIVKPTFWESTLGQILIVLMILGILAAIVYTLLYIRNIKRKQHETLEAYLSLLQQHTSNSTEPIANIQAPKTEDPLLQRVMQFVEENISNSEAGVGDMASAAAVSRSGLQRKLKQAMGITPQDLLKEARIKRACQLLRQTDKNVAEVAYACGFSDPKYFSRSFKQSTGKSPTEYRDGVEE